MPDKSIYEYMRLAMAEAEKCQSDVPVGAIILRGSEIVASGFNQREAAQDPLGHAELSAISLATKKLGTWRLQDCTIFCTLEPCPMCAEAIIQSRMERLVFGAYDLVAGAAGSVFNLFANRQALPVPELIGGILEDECAAMLRDFFREQRQKKGKPI